MTVAARRAGVPMRTARRRLAAYKLAGRPRIEPVGAGDRGGRRMTRELIEGMALRRPPPAGRGGVSGGRQDRRGSRLAGTVLHGVRRVIVGLDRGLLRWRIAFRTTIGTADMTWIGPSQGCSRGWMKDWSGSSLREGPASGSPSACPSEVGSCLLLLRRCRRRPWWLPLMSGRTVSRCR